MTILSELKRLAEEKQARQSKTEATEYVKAYSFRGAALALQSAMEGEVVISGPSETGKSIAALARVDSLCRSYPDLQVAMIRKVRADMNATVLQLFEREIMRGDVQKFGGRSVEFYEYPNKSRIWVGGMDRPGKVLSGARDVVYVNQAEELHLSDWEIFSTRTTGRAGTLKPGLLLGDVNPGPPTHWIKSRSELTMLESRHEDNPMLYDDNGNITAQGIRTIKVLDALTGVRKERLRYGRWVAAEGSVYEFDTRIHLIDRFDIPKDWRRIRVIDFGFTNPFVCQWWAIDGDGTMYLYREIYMTQRTVRVHAGKINSLSEGEYIDVTISDHDAEDRATLDECGIGTLAATKDVTPGIQKVQERLAFKKDDKPSPRILVMRGALVECDESLLDARKPTCTEQEFDSYVWPKSSDGKPVKEIPVKDNDHGMDAMRYAVMHLDVGNYAMFPADYYDNEVEE